jgi:hypothetical protein
VSLKELLLYTRGRLIGLKATGPVLISERLHVRLKNYAACNGMSVAAVLERCARKSTGSPMTMRLLLQIA